MTKIVLVILFFVLLALERRYIYWTYQRFGSTLGLNLNNIALKGYVDWINSQPDDFENNQEAVFLNKNITFRDILALQNNILGQSTSPGERWIDIDLSEQKLRMKEGQTTVGEFLVSTGKWAPTPRGQWRIWTKLRYTRMKGGSKALGTFYDLPNVPYTMYYYKGYGIHGAYWHNNFGQPMSHGCVNMKPEEAGIVFNWANVGTRVVVQE